MYLTRQKASRKLPVPRKGTKYLARASSHLNDSVPVVIAIRDMLHLAQNAREVKHMIKSKALKINGKPVRDYRESIKLFNILEADKQYRLSFLPTGKFTLKEIKNEDRLCKVIGKSLIRGNKLQLNLHDGTNLITEKKNISTNDSVYLDEKSKIAGHIPLEKGREVFVVAGKHLGSIGKAEKIDGRNVLVKLNDGGEALLQKKVLFALK